MVVETEIRGSDRIPDEPVLYSELEGGANDSYDRFDWKLAWPSSSNLRIQFLILAIINAVVSTVCLVLIVGILRYHKIRRNSFNLYILFISIPDFFVSFFCLLTCSMSAPGGQYYSEWMCSFQSFYLVFGFTANCWMNAVVVYEVHRLLRLSRRRERYMPPTKTVVFRQVVAVYLYSTFWALTSVWHFPRWPQTTQLLYGFNCFPNEYDSPSSALFYYLVFIPAFVIIPILYASFVVWDIWRRKLLPPTGRRRDLALYFARVTVVYFAMWTPFLIICTVGNFVYFTFWVYWVGAIWAHLQGLVSAVVSSTRLQIKHAMIDCYRCVPEKDRKERISFTLRTPSSDCTCLKAVNCQSSPTDPTQSVTSNNGVSATRPTIKSLVVGNISLRSIHEEAGHSVHCGILEDRRTIEHSRGTHQSETLEYDSSDEEMYALIHDDFEYDDDDLEEKEDDHNGHGISEGDAKRHSNHFTDVIMNDDEET